MKIENVFIVDTNVLISAHLIENSISDKAFRKAMQMGFIGMSEAMMTELVDVLYRKKFDKYFREEMLRLELIRKIEEQAVTFVPTEKITACRDPNDNRILELATAAQATCIITGDSDLLTLHPFHDIPILSPAAFLEKDYLP